MNQEVYVVMLHDTTDDYAYCLWVFANKETAQKEMRSVAHENIFYLWIHQSDEFIEVWDDDYNKFWEEHTLEDIEAMNSEKELDNVIVHDNSVSMYWYWRTVTIMVEPKFISYE